MLAPTSTRISSAGKLAWGLVIVLAILRYDFWAWDDRSLMFGFVPIGLFYQILISIGAAVAWALVVRFAWPSHIEEWAGTLTPSKGDTDTPEQGAGR